MPKIKILYIVGDDGYYDYDNYIWQSFMPEGTQWEDVSEEDLNILLYNKKLIPIPSFMRKRDTTVHIAVMEDDMAAEDTLKTVKELIEEIKRKAEEVKKKREEDKKKREEKKRKADEAKEKKELLRLAEKFGVPIDGK